MNTELMTNIISGKILDKKVLFIGLDGASKKIIDDMIRKKELPNIEALINTGAYFCSHSFEPVVSPVIWTSMSSGKKPEKHGIRNFYDTAKSLTAKRIWDIFNDLGFPIGVLGHFVTWPPNKVNGFIIPDILALDSKCYPERYGFMWELTNEAKNEKRTGVIKILKYIWQSYRNHIRVLTLLQAIIVSLANKTHLVDEQDRMFIWRVIKTKLHRDLFVKLLKDFSPKYSFIHIHLLDFCSHRFWKYMQPDSYENIMRNGIEHHGHKIYAAYKTIDKIAKKSLRKNSLLKYSLALSRFLETSFKINLSMPKSATGKKL